MNEPTTRSVTNGDHGTAAGNHGGTACERVSTSVVIAIAEAKRADPVELEESLHDWVDPDALDALVSSMENGHVGFDVADSRVHVDADETVTVSSID